MVWFGVGPGIIRGLRYTISILQKWVSIMTTYGILGCCLYSTVYSLFRLLVLMFIQSNLSEWTRSSNTKNNSILTRNKVHYITYIVVFVSSDVCAKFDMSDMVYEAYDGINMQLWRHETLSSKNKCEKINICFIQSLSTTTKSSFGTMASISTNEPKPCPHSISSDFEASDLHVFNIVAWLKMFNCYADQPWTQPGQTSVQRLVFTSGLRKWKKLKSHKRT